uniref:Uncharacterized protein n=1 Tax=Anguilla anguilla TaxID=7936 RepID=A0A0E9XPX1_ANGAN
MAHAYNIDTHTRTHMFTLACRHTHC